MENLLTRTKEGVIDIGSTTPNKPICVFFKDGKVTLREDLDFSAVSSLEMPYLLLVREMIDKAIQEKEQR